MRCAILLSLASVTLALPANAQIDPVQPAFEAATVKPNHTTDPGVYSRFEGLTVALTNLTLKRMIVFAYQVRDFQATGGPNWIDSDHFDIEAKTSPDASVLQKLLMVQTLMKDRFQLTLHRATKDFPIYNLIVAKGGLKIRPLPEDTCVRPDPSRPGPPTGKPRDGSCGGSFGPTTIRHGSATMADMVTMLSVVLGRTVVDKTGVTGQFTVQLAFAPVDPSASQNTDRGTSSDAPSIFTALQDQLGLRLDSARGPVEVLVVDHAEKPSDN
jgi:uncharacterized protein (TIGR03435 family)